MKLPAFMFYPGDWLKDPAVSLLTSASRGIWIDLLCAMHEADRSGQISGTPEQLARLARCTAVEFAAALADFQTHRAADVTERNGLVTVVNRRMKRERKAREATRLRVSRHRGHDPGNGAETNLKRQSNTPLSTSVSSSEAAPTDRERDRNAGWPDLKTVLAWAQMIGCPPDQAEKFWNHFESAGWIDKNGHAIVNARAKLAVWRDDHRAASVERQHHASEPRAASGTASLIHKQEQLKRVEEAITKLRNNKPDPVTTDWSVKIRSLKAQRTQLRHELGFPDV